MYDEEYQTALNEFEGDIENAPMPEMLTLKYPKAVT
jgi:hypothetical protein